MPLSCEKRRKVTAYSITKGKFSRSTPRSGHECCDCKESGVYDGAVLTPSGYRSTRAGAGWLLAPAGAPASDGAPASFNLPLKKQPAGLADAPASLVKKEPAASLSANALTCDGGPGGMQRTSGLHSEFCALAAGTGSHPAAELAACTDGRHPAAGSSSGIIRSRDDGEPAGARVRDSPPRKRTQRSDDPVPGSICIYYVLEEPRERLCVRPSSCALALAHGVFYYGTIRTTVPSPNARTCQLGSRTPWPSTRLLTRAGNSNRMSPPRRAIDWPCCDQWLVIRWVLT